MTREEILSMTKNRMKISIALALGIGVYDTNGSACSLGQCRLALAEPGDPNIPQYWERITDLSQVPDVVFIFVTGEDYWLASRPSSPEYLRAQLTKEWERERYIEALMEICTVDASLVYISGERWADYTGLWRLVNASDGQQMRAWLITKSCV